MPAQLPLIPYDVTATIMFVLSAKIGPAESPKHVPPVFALLVSQIEVFGGIPDEPPAINQRFWNAIVD